MFKQNTLLVFRSFACGLLCAIATNVSAQETLLPPVPADPDGFSQQQVETVPPLNTGDLEGEYETLTRGPLHEAFAEPIVADPAPGLVVEKEPPVPINELAPEYRPDGDDAIWISGYWGWDEQREDFIWISGVYRVPPEGHQWVPGYWHVVDDGWQWVQGFWVEEAMESIAYLPPPPATLEYGPSSPSPGVDYFYIPGSWSQSQSLATSSGYSWNAGYWHLMQNDLVWIPAHVVWTPRGCVYVNGYWDQRLPMRGLCFAPVYIPRVTYSRPGWALRPSVVLNTQVVLHNLFIQPRYNHYLFGDYYGLPANRRNVVPAYVYHQSRGACDPLISFYSAYNARQGQDMMRWYGNQYADLSRNPSKRPPQIWSANNMQGNPPTGASGIAHSQIAHKVDQFNKFDIGPKVTPISASLQRDILKGDLDRKRFAKDREVSERKPQPIESIANPAIVPPKLTLPKLEPIGRKNDLVGKNASEIRKSKMPEQPRNTARPVDRNPRETNTVEALRKGDSTPKSLEPKDFDLKNKEPRRVESPNRLEPNRITNPLSTERVLERLRQSEQNRTIVPKIQTPLPQSNPLPQINPSQPKKEQRGPNLQPRLPNIETRIPKIESRLPNLEPRLRNTEPRQPSQPIIRVPQPNRIEPSNEDRQKPNRGKGPTSSLQTLPRNITPAQPVVPSQPVAPRLASPPKLQGNNVSAARSIPQVDRQPKPGNSPPTRPQDGRKNSDRKEEGKRPK